MAVGLYRDVVYRCIWPDFNEEHLLEAIEVLSKAFAKIWWRVI